MRTKLKLLFFLLGEIFKIIVGQDYTVTENDVYILGGILQTGISNEDDCISYCKEDDSCLAMDYFYEDETCFTHEYDTICDPTIVEPGVKHVKFARCVENAHITGGLHQRSIHSFSLCISRCQGRPDCYAVDYHAVKSECWFHHKRTMQCPYKMYRRRGITHIQMASCISDAARLSEVEVTFTSLDLPSIYESHTNSHAYNGLLQRGITTWQACVRSCQGACSSVDFDIKRGQTCWHHTDISGCQGLAYKQGCTHYKIRPCILSAGNPVVQESLLPNLMTISTHLNDFISSPAPECGQPAISPIGARIMGGTEAVPHSWPWMVALHHHGASRPRCAGSLITDQWVLTTAHCMDQDPVPTKWQVYVGSHDLKATNQEASFDMHAVRQVIIHPDFDLSTFDNDIALLQLDVPVRLSAAVSTVCLPPDGTVLEHGRSCVITGWGNPPGSRRPLKQAGVPLVSLGVCRRQDWLGKEFLLSDRMICAGEELGGVDTCQGDSGGPLQCYDGLKWIQVGVTSFGRGCALPKRPGVYSNVALFKQWIKQFVNVY